MYENAIKARKIRASSGLYHVMAMMLKVAMMSAPNIMTRPAGKGEERGGG